MVTSSTKNIIFALLGIFFVGGGLLVLAPTLMQVGGGGDGPLGPSAPGQTEIVGECRETATTTVQIDMFNELNETGSENMTSRTGYLYRSASPLVYVASLATGDDTAVDCGYDYVWKVVLQTHTGADTGTVTKLRGVTGVPGTEITDDFNLKLHTSSANFYAKVDGQKKGHIEVRVYDIDNDAYVYMANATSATAWNATDDKNSHTGLSTVTWWLGNTSVNGSYAAGVYKCTGLELTAGQELNYRVEMRVNGSDMNYNDRGVIFAIDATTARWNIPVVQFDGVTLSNIKGTLKPSEERTYADYEYVYLVDKDILDDIHQLNIKIKLLAGVACTTGTSPQLIMGVRGNFLSSIDNTEVKVGSVTDDSSPTQNFIHTIMNLSVCPNT